MALLELKCCPKCGSIISDEVGKIRECDICHCVQANIGKPIDVEEWWDLTFNHEDKYNKMCQDIRQQYTLNSPQFDQAAWDRRVGIENGTIKVPEKPEPKPVPKCPTCGSTDVHRISTLNRGASVAMWGLFSGKIGKNYECENCKARW